MNWETVAAISQTVSALALVLVLMQVRHARADMRRSVLNEMSASIISVSAMSVDTRLIAATIKADAAMGAERHPFVVDLMEQTGVTEEGARLIYVRESAMWHAMAVAIRNIDALKPEDKTAMAVNMRRLYAKSPVGRLWYQHAKGGVAANPSVMRFVDGALAQPD